MIKTNGLTRIFRTCELETTVLNKVTLKVWNGELVAIMGPSDCSKSTLPNIIGIPGSLTALLYLLNNQDKIY